MLARIIASTHGKSFKNPHIFTIKFLHTNTTPPTQSHFLVDFLVNSLGFTKQEAVTTSNKVTRLNPTKNPQFVINFFEKYGFDNSQIKKIVFNSPKLLFANVDKTLKPKLDMLHEIGLNSSELVHFTMSNVHIFHRGVDTFLRPSLDYLRSLLGGDDNVLKAIKKASWLLGCNAPKVLEPNVLVLRGIGFSDVKLRKFILQYPRVMTRKSEWVEDVVVRLEREFEIPRESPMFFHGIIAIVALSASTVARKVETYRSFGWSDEHIRSMVKNLPFCVGLSEAKICKQLTFLMKEVGCSSEYLASRPKLLMYSLENRVIPRYRVLKVLHGKGLRKHLGLYSVVCMTSSRFMEDVVLPYKDKIPSLYESYMKSI